VATVFTGTEQANAVLVQPDGKIVTAGFSLNEADFEVVRYNANGTLDPGFGTGGKVATVFTGTEQANAVLVQPDGKIVAAGYTTGANEDIAVARYTANGTLDSGFGTGGKVTTSIGASDDAGFGAVLQPDGKIVVAGGTFNGSSEDFAVVRYNANGTLDSSFGSGGKVTTSLGSHNDFGQAVVLQPDGKIVVGGYTSTGTAIVFAVVRYNTNGSLDTSFGSGGKVIAPGSATEEALGVALEPDGRIVLAGLTIVGVGDFDVMRFNTDGSLDTSFGSGGKVTTDVTPGQFDVGRAVAVQPDGKIVVTGITEGASPEDFAVVRYNLDGSLDGTFGAGGIVRNDLYPGTINEAHAIVIQPDGQIVVAGRVDTPGEDFGVARYLGWAVLASPDRVAPGGTTTVKGQGFSAHEAVDVYLDTTDLALAAADGVGAFHVPLNVPAGTAPGAHWVTAVGRTSGQAYQIPLSVGADWPMFQFGPEHTGADPYETALTTGNVAKLHLLWRTAQAAGTHQTPAEQGGLVYGVGASVFAADAGTGAQAWTSAPIAGASPPAASGGGVLVSSTDGNMYDLDSGSGLTRWTTSLGGGTGGPAAISDGVAYVGTSTGRVVALDASTGQSLPSWTVFTAGGGIAGAPAVSDGAVYVGASDGKVYALDASTGALLSGWPAVEGSANFVSSPSVDAGTLFIGGQNDTFYALDAETGSTLWAAKLKGAAVSSPAFDGGVVYTGANDGKLYAFDEDTGTAVWGASLGGPVGSSPSIANGVVYATVQSKKKLIALNAATGAKLRSIETKSNPSSSIVADGVVYVSGATGLQAFGISPAKKTSVPRPDPHSLVPDRGLSPQP
jgi:uncharacterized delta-60 repeat protein